MELVTLDEAARAVDRSRDTIRRWLRAGRLTRREGELPAGGGSRPVLVDLDELRRLVVELGIEAEPGRREREAHPPAGAVRPSREAELAAELAAAREVAALRVELAELRGRVALAEREAHLAREALADLRMDRDAWRDRTAALEAELAAVRAAGAASWWRRLLTG